MLFKFLAAKYSDWLSNHCVCLVLNKYCGFSELVGQTVQFMAVKQKAMKEYPQYLHVQLDCFDIQTDETAKQQLLLSGHGRKTTSLYVACYLQNLQWDCVSE